MKADDRWMRYSMFIWHSWFVFVVPWYIVLDHACCIISHFASADLVYHILCSLVLQYSFTSKIDGMVKAARTYGILLMCLSIIMASTNNSPIYLATVDDLVLLIILRSFTSISRMGTTANPLCWSCICNEAIEMVCTPSLSCVFPHYSYWYIWR